MSHTRLEIGVWKVVAYWKRQRTINVLKEHLQHEVRLKVTPEKVSRCGPFPITHSMKATE